MILVGAPGLHVMPSDSIIIMYAPASTESEPLAFVNVASNCVRPLRQHLLDKATGGDQDVVRMPEVKQFLQTAAERLGSGCLWVKAVGDQDDAIGSRLGRGRQFFDLTQWVVADNRANVR